MDGHVPTSRPTRIYCELVNGTARFSVLDQGSYLAPRPIHTVSPAEGQHAHVRVALIGISMMLLGGDDVVIDVNVGPGVALEIVEPAGLVAYNADGESSAWALNAVVGAGGILMWSGAAFVAAAGSNSQRTMNVSLAQGGRALIRDVLVLGRSGEKGGLMRSIMRITGPDGEYVVEDLDLTGSSREAIGVLGGSKVMAAITVAGWRPPATDSVSADGVTLQLACEGSIRRAIGTAAHQVDTGLAGTYEEWRAGLLDQHARQ